MGHDIDMGVNIDCSSRKEHSPDGGGGRNQCEKSGREGLLKKVKENALPPISWKVTPEVLLSVTGWIMGEGNQSIDWSCRNLMLN